MASFEEINKHSQENFGKQITQKKLEDDFQM